MVWHVGMIWRRLMATVASENPYLAGNFGPVREETTVTQLEVTGTIPAHLDGRYVRNGPNPVTDPDPASYHWFLGSGMVHGVRVRDGRAEWYRSRYVRSADVAAALGEEPRRGPVHAGFDFAANTHVIGHAGRTFALVESGPRPYELTDELDSVGPCDFDGTLPGGYTAHPLADPETGELHAVSYFFGWGNKVQYSVLGTDGSVRRTVDIEVGGSPMMHAFSLTERYVVIYDLPVTFDAALAANRAPRPFVRPTRRLMSRTVGRRRIPDRMVEMMMRGGGNPSLPYWWNPDYPARVGVMPRHGGASDVQWFDIEPCFVYHPMNAFDDGDCIVADVVRHPKSFATDRHGPNEDPPTLDRWTLDLGSGKAREERLDDRGQEFPRIDERVVGRPHRYGYAVASHAREDGSFELEASALVKHDVASQHTEIRRFDPGCVPGEFVFVPESPTAGEDAGTLMGFVYNAGEDRSDLVFLDAETLKTVASIHLPVRVPYGFHGSWIPSRMASR
jgi:carotenoid cleavage oxygenase